MKFTVIPRPGTDPYYLRFKNWQFDIASFDPDVDIQVPTKEETARLELEWKEKK